MILVLLAGGDRLRSQDCAVCGERYPISIWPEFTDYELSASLPAEPAIVEVPEACLVNGGPGNAGGVAFDGENVFFRFCLSGKPSGDGGFADVNYLVEIGDANGRHLLTVGLCGMNQRNDYVYVIAPNQLYEQVVYSYSEYPEMARIVKAGSRYFLDVQLPLCALNHVYCLYAGSRRMITSSTPLRFFAGTSDAKHMINRNFISGTSVDFSLCKPMFLDRILGGTSQTDGISLWLKRSPSTVVLQWQSAIVAYEDQFDIERSIDNGPWKRINTVPGFAAVSSNNTFVYNDPITSEGLRQGKAMFRIRQRMADGSSVLSPPSVMTFSRSPKLELHQNFPNPFSGTTNISFTLPKPQWVTIHVFNAMGYEVARPVDHRRYDEGSHSVSFSNIGLPNGQYRYRLVTEYGSQNRLMYAIR